MENTDSSFSLLELFNMGGIFMWPLLLFSIATVAVALERAFYIFYHNLRLDDLYDTVRRYIEKDDIPGAWQYLKGVSRRRIGARILLVIVERAQRPEHHIEKAAEAEALSLINSLENGFSFLTALGSLSPLTGFLGTVSGMIGAFKSIAEATDVNAQIVANGIYEALITTVFGLIIAIIAMAAHSLFTHVVDKFAADLEKNCSDLIMEIVQTEKISSWRKRQAATLFSGIDVAVLQDVMAPDSYQLYTADFPAAYPQKPSEEDSEEEPGQDG
ncbi:MAG: MotA/TolQ/ExbB proton channel family protein [Treponema sp.]|jgi:biopolymer transport protein ExbB|nr:MotA/TolQ/ExbB proton channel family protein [Treponema sp.]